MIIPSMIRDFLSELKWRLVGLLGKLFIDLLFLTIKIESRGFEKVRGLIESRKNVFALWHSRILPFSYLYKGHGSAIMVSASGDGEIIARIVERQGQKPVRGSSKKGGMKALEKIVEAMSANPPDPGTVIPDGPQGPRYRVQKGVVLLARRMGRPIVPVTYGVRRGVVFRSWDRFILPLPFTRCRIVYGNPVHVSPDADEDGIELKRKELEKQMRRLTEEVDGHFGHQTP
jgi:lysophospholipid acyltransferase (LPLAT)-like uncharacterized protein